MNKQTADLDYCGILIMLRQLIRSGACTETEAKKVAARIAARLGISIIVSL